eukprot:CAMPEP_0198513154 /NCGR_PEP_ID=MMETSP1462-20131121/15889_1 /TAXON_ID=1333877 /ORGANISM="Brandtodinium nutriculum, Strain RCC3387" /LENGTH=48 /DNA_ID= /DNA_START= /DNA_END= /DNA_ORIENTATION=
MSQMMIFPVEMMGHTFAPDGEQVEQLYPEASFLKQWAAIDQARQLAAY